MACKYNAPGDDDSRLPDPGSHLLQQHVAWNFEDDVCYLRSSVSKYCVRQRKGLTNEVDRLNPIVFVRGHLEFVQDISVFSNLQDFTTDAFR